LAAIAAEQATRNEKNSHPKAVLRITKPPVTYQYQTAGLIHLLYVILEFV
jgi:hypothetical protein